MDHHSTQSRKAPVDGLWDFTYGRRTCRPRAPHSSCLPTFPQPWLRMDPGDPSGDPVGDAAGTPADGQDPLLFLQALRTLWSTRERQQLREEAWRGFASLGDPLAGLLAMLESGQGWQGTGPSLEVWVACELSCWLQARPCPGLAQGSPGLKQLQARAVRVLAKSTPRLVEPLVSIFQLQDAERRPLLAHIHQLHQDGKFKEAIMLGTKLKLQPELDVEKMCTPLLLQDKASLVERYVAGFPDLQRRLLALMDSWCRPGFDIRTVSRRLPQVTPRRLEKLSPKALMRQVLSLREKYGLDPALCPHAATQQCLAALRFLCCKRFVERSMSQENWADCVQGLVGQSPWLQEQLLQLLASHGDTATATHCALDLFLPEGRLPATVAAELSCLRLQESSAPPRPAGGPSADRTDGHYQLPIARRDIHFLASWEDLASHEEELLQPGRVVGVDVEWRPSFGVGGRPRPSLMQLAVEGHVFLLDLPVFLEPAGGLVTLAFSQLVSRLLLDPSITKLGYGMTEDLRSLGTSCPALAHVEKQLQGGLDLLQAHRQMWMADEPVRGVARAGGPRGLSLLVQQVLGKPLDKTQQLSNWDRRPLSEEQLVYAAADAYCLLEVYQALCREPARFHLLDNLARSPRPGHSKRSGAGELPGWQEASAPALQVPVAEGEDAAPAVPARAFRVVCDNMLQGLARSLRCLGVDALVLGTGEDHRRAAEACNCDQYLKVSKNLMRQLMWPSDHQEGPSSIGDEAAHSEDIQEAGLALEEGPGGYAYDPPCRWLEATDLQAGVPATLGNGTRLQLAGVPAGVLARPGLRSFYCCTGCGKVFWEGSHLGRIAAHFSEVLGGAPGSRAQPPSAPPEDQPPTLPAYFRQGPTVKVKKAPAKRT
ncbi:exonuclease mut-7 homolog isoform X3 [Manis javanica]|uniref:exonuclease mut-7 homolog isoform X3 n=1 Tax=Manis javanica TaxID=9974 RepID=UPI003C6D5D38